MVPIRYRYMPLMADGCYNTVMIVELLRWWYGIGWMRTVHRVGTWAGNVEHAFSVATLIRTLFAPWRRIVSASGRSMDAKVHDALDNFVSRCVGFAVRSIVLLAAGLAGTAALLAGSIMVIIWPLLPLAVIYCLIRSVAG
jgi:hypothetical protein